MSIRDINWEAFVLADKLNEAISAAVNGIQSQKTEIIHAFIAKHGFDPDQAIQYSQTIEGGHRWWIAQRPDGDICPTCGHPLKVTQPKS